MKALIPLLLILIMTQTATAKETVVLLHGLARSASSMKKMKTALESEGYHVINIDYPSRQHTIETLATMVREDIEKQTKGTAPLHFVTHSMGGILVRQIQKTDPLKSIGRVVMLSPPNQGSEVIDRIGDHTAVQKVNGPAGAQLGTAPDGFVAKLGPVDFELGVLTGDRSINWINSCMLPGRNDGKVSIQSAKVEGMADYKVVHATHPMIMKKASIIKEVITFLKTGAFSKESE